MGGGEVRGGGGGGRRKVEKATVPKRSGERNQTPEEPPDTSENGYAWFCGTRRKRNHPTPPHPPHGRKPMRRAHKRSSTTRKTSARGTLPGGSIGDLNSGEQAAAEEAGSPGGMFMGAESRRGRSKWGWIQRALANVALAFTKKTNQVRSLLVDDTVWYLTSI